MARNSVVPNETEANPDDDPRGDWASGNMVGLATEEQRPNLHFDLINPKTKTNYGCPEKGWRYDPKTMKRLIEENRILWPESSKGRPRRKVFLSELQTEFTGFSSIIAPNVFTRDGSVEIRRIFGEEVFAFPKPSELLRILVDQATFEDSLVLDSFAGTGTTAHAVLKLNAVDGGDRRFILVQQPFETKEQEANSFNTCQKITRNRVSKVIEGYSYSDNGKGSQKTNVDGLGGSFTYARLGAPLFGEYRDLGDNLPAYHELAKYIFYTETSREFDAKEINAKTGRIGEHKGTAYYLLYTPDSKKDGTLDTEWLKEIGEKEKCKKLVVYCEKVWLHREDLLAWQEKTGKSVRQMLVPFQLK